MNIYGFVGKPETAKKTRGDQYFFVNNRFIKSPYLNHAVMSAFSDMIAKDSFPMYALFIDLDPSRLDINVHPTKQEIKFEDEKIVYAFVQSAIKHALAQFSVTPTLDFDLDPAIQNTEAVSQPFTAEKRSIAAGTGLYETFTQKNQAHFIERKSNLRSWEQTDNGRETSDVRRETSHEQGAISNEQQAIAKEQGEISKGQQEIGKDQPAFQIHNTYIITQHANGFIAIHQQNAHERILYERFCNAIKDKPISTQASLFPVTFDLSPSDTVILNELLPDLHVLGYTIEPFGKTSFIIQGIPADVTEGNEKQAIEKMLDQYKHFSNDLKFSKREKLLRAMAWQSSVKPGVALSTKEMATLIEDLFNCQTSNTTPAGKPVYLEFKRDELDKMFGR
jgi:DNA mismatch repair protein MutL